jgi:peptidoglycan/LPS O-acetylase OafA/YrhL
MQLGRSIGKVRTEKGMRISLVTQILEWSPLRWIGRISYSLYLWQELLTQRFLERRPLGHLDIFKRGPSISF